MGHIADGRGERYSRPDAEIRVLAVADRGADADGLRRKRGGGTE